MPPAHLLPDPLPAGAANRLVRTCLAEADALDTLAPVLFPLLQDPAAEAKAEEARRTLLGWADEAQALFDRVCDAPDLDPIERQKLAAVIRLNRRPPISTTEFRRRVARVEAGEYITREEARRELGLPHRPRRVAVDPAA